MDPSSVWPIWCALRDRLATRYWYRHGQHIPREEYVSAGNQALAECAAYGQEDTGVITAELHYAMRQVPRAQMPRGNTIASPQGQRVGVRVDETLPYPPSWSGWDTYLLPAYPSGDQRTLADELLEDLTRYADSQAVHCLLYTAWGWRTRELPALVGCSRASANRKLARVRRLIAERKPLW